MIYLDCDEYTKMNITGSCNMDLRKLAVNLLPFPRLKFLSISDAPLMCNKNMKYEKLNIQHLLTELFHSHQFMSNIEIGRDMNGWNGKYLAASVIFRGNRLDSKVNEYEIQSGLKDIMLELRAQNECLTNIPHFIHSTLVYRPSLSHPLTGTLFANNTAIKHLYQRNLTRFKKFFQKKAYVQYYTRNGTLDSDFEEAMNDVQDLIEDYDDKDSQPQTNQDTLPPTDILFKLNDTHRKRKLQRNNQWWSQFANDKRTKHKHPNKKQQQKTKGVIKKNKKIYVKPKNNNNHNNNNKRIVIIPNKRKKQLEKEKKNKDKKNQNKKKKVLSKNTKKGKSKRKKKQDSDDDDFEEISSSSSSEEAESSDDSDSNDSSDSSSSSSSSSTATDESDSNQSSDSSNDTSSYGLGNKSSDDNDSNDSDDSDDSNSSDDNSTDSEQTDSD